MEFLLGFGNCTWFSSHFMGTLQTSVDLLCVKPDMVSVNMTIEYQIFFQENRRGRGDASPRSKERGLGVSLSLFS
jgi:hypothetical protein